MVLMAQIFDNFLKNRYRQNCTGYRILYSNFLKLAEFYSSVLIQTIIFAKRLKRLLFLFSRRFVYLSSILTIVLQLNSIPNVMSRLVFASQKLSSVFSIVKNP